MEPAFSSWSQEDSVSQKHSQQSLDKPKKPRHRHSALQLAALNELFDKNDHPPLDERQALAEQLNMETKTVNAWFQNKRASTKKRHRGGAPTSNSTNQSLDLPPISSILASAPASSSSSPPRLVDRDSYEADFNGPTLPLPRIDKPSTRPHQVVLLEESSREQVPFYAGNPDHHHSFDRNSSPPPSDLPARPRIRMRPTSQQTDELRRFYQVNPHPTKEEREELGERIGMRYQSITNWFQNQRSLAKKRQEEDAELEAEAVAKDKAERIYASFPPASNHASLLPPSHPSLSALVHRRTRSPSAPPSNASASSRASPYRSVLPSQRPRRTRPEAHQLEALQKLYNRTSNPSIEERSALSLEVGMDLAKVTNWFRNIRQTARKRTRKHGDDGDTDSLRFDSASVSRAATPSFSSSSSAGMREHDMDSDIDDPDHPMDEDEDYLHAPQPAHPVHVPSDPASDDEDHEPKTPSPEPAPVPVPRSYNSYIPPAVSRPRDFSFTIDDHTYAKLKQLPGRVSGVEVEDALLLLGFHHHAVH